MNNIERMRIYAENNIKVLDMLPQLSEYDQGKLVAFTGMLLFLDELEGENEGGDV